MSSLEDSSDCDYSHTSASASEDNLAEAIENTLELRVGITDPSGTSSKEIRIDVNVNSEMESTEHSPVTDTDASNTSTRVFTEHSPVTSTRPPVAVTDSSDRLESTEHSPVTDTDVSNTFTEHFPVNEAQGSSSTARSSDLSTLQSEITPRGLDDDFRVMDNPIFRPTAVSSESESPEHSPVTTYRPTSPYGSAFSASPIDERNPYQLHRHQIYGLQRFFLHFCAFLERIGV